MRAFKAVKDFIDWVTYEDNDLPFGGLKDDAPETAREAYAKYLAEEAEAEAQGIKL